VSKATAAATTLRADKNLPFELLAVISIKKSATGDGKRAACEGVLLS
jgi:hypothetical protein